MEPAAAVPSRPDPPAALRIVPPADGLDLARAERAAAAFLDALGVATDGDATGMKWLAGKARCLTVRVGEGYCRD